MQNIEPLRFFLAEDRGDDRVDEGLDRTVPEGGDETTHDEQIVSEVCVASLGDEVGGYSEDRPDDVAAAGEEHRRLVADLVDKKAEKDDTHGKGPDADPGENAELLLVEIELGAPHS